MAYPALAVSVNAPRDPCSILELVGLIDPPVPALAVTVYFLSLNAAVTVHAALSDPVVYSTPESVPAQPEIVSSS